MSIETRVYTWFQLLFGRGDLVGVDEFGNRYYRSGRAKLHGRERRWVLYRGEAEASRVPPEWHAWLHHTTEAPLTEKAAQARSWQRDHQPNLTGSVAAYRPPGHDSKGGRRSRATGDYEPWTPR